MEPWVRRLKVTTTANNNYEKQLQLQTQLADCADFVRDGCPNLECAARVEFGRRDAPGAGEVPRDWVDEADDQLDRQLDDPVGGHGDAPVVDAVVHDEQLSGNASICTVYILAYIHSICINMYKLKHINYMYKYVHMNICSSSYISYI